VYTTSSNIPKTNLHNNGWGLVNGPEITRYNSFNHEKSFYTKKKKSIYTKILFCFGILLLTVWCNQHTHKKKDNTNGNQSFEDVLTQLNMWITNEMKNKVKQQPRPLTSSSVEDEG
jgi:hypothetical protein